MQKIVVFDNIGKVVITKKNGLRSLRLNIHPAKGVSMSIPTHASYDQAIAFLNTQKDWVVQKLAVFNSQGAQKLVLNDGYSIAGVRIKLQYHDKNRLTAKIEENTLFVFLPENLDYQEEVAQKFLKKACEIVLKNKAIDIIPQKVVAEAKKNLFHHGNIKIGNSLSRWGSCNSDNRLIFSCYLMLLPEELIDFVIIHELCHTVHKNHGIKFHQLVDKLCSGREKELSQKLKKARHPLMNI